MATQRIKQIIDEIRELSKEPTHKSAHRIHSLMENNKKGLIEIMDENDVNYLLSGFENVSHKNPSEFKSQSGVDEYNKLCGNFLFHCNRVI